MLFCLHVLLDGGASGFGTSVVPAGKLGFKRTEGDITEQNEGMDVTLSELTDESEGGITIM